MSLTDQLHLHEPPALCPLPFPPSCVGCLCICMNHTNPLPSFSPHPLSLHLASLPPLPSPTHASHLPLRLVSLPWLSASIAAGVRLPEHIFFPCFKQLPALVGGPGGGEREGRAGEGRGGGGVREGGEGGEVGEEVRGEGRQGFGLLEREQWIERGVEWKESGKGAEGEGEEDEEEEVGEEDVGLETEGRERERVGVVRGVVGPHSECVECDGEGIVQREMMQRAARHEEIRSERCGVEAGGLDSREAASAGHGGLEARGAHVLRCAERTCSHAEACSATASALLGTYGNLVSVSRDTRDSRDREACRTVVTALHDLPQRLPTARTRVSDAAECDSAECVDAAEGNSAEVDAGDSDSAECDCDAERNSSERDSEEVDAREGDSAALRLTWKEKERDARENHKQQRDSQDRLRSDSLQEFAEREVPFDEADSQVRSEWLGSGSEPPGAGLESLGLVSEAQDTVEMGGNEWREETGYAAAEVVRETERVVDEGSGGLDDGGDLRDVIALGDVSGPGPISPGEMLLAAAHADSGAAFVHAGNDIPDMLHTPTSHLSSQLPPVISFPPAVTVLPATALTRSPPPHPPSHPHTLELLPAEPRPSMPQDLVRQQSKPGSCKVRECALPEVWWESSNIHDLCCCTSCCYSCSAACPHSCSSSCSCSCSSGGGGSSSRERVSGSSGGIEMPWAWGCVRWERRVEAMEQAKGLVRARRGGQRQPASSLPRPPAPSVLLDDLAWSVSEPPTEARMLGSLVSGGVEEVGMGEGHGSDGAAGAAGAGGSCASVGTRMHHSQLSALLYPHAFLTLLFPLDVYSEVAPSARSYFSPAGFSSLRLLSLVYSFYQ
ncbi:unnamed protein product, partial [Closterium sp. Naga37s-1]